MLDCRRKLSRFLYDKYKNRFQDFKAVFQGVLKQFIIEANPDDIHFFLVALEEENMLEDEKFKILLKSIRSLETDQIFSDIDAKLSTVKKIFDRTFAIANNIKYDVFILHCEADIAKAKDFQQKKLGVLKGLDPPAKTILYDEFVVPGTRFVSALDYVLEDCRLVFILCTQEFMKQNAAKFLSEVVRCIGLEKRVYPVYLTKIDQESAHKWLKTDKFRSETIYAWSRSGDLLTEIIRNGRIKYNITS